MSGELVPDPKAAIAFLGLLRPDGPWVLTAITPDGPTTTETFTKATAVAAWIKRQNAKRNIYWMPAKATGTLRKKATKGEVAGSSLLWADLDGIFDIGYLNGQVPPPTTVVASGGGLNLYWALAEPIDYTAEIEARNRWLEKQLNADECHNCDRILRLAGTINWPTKTKAAKGRIPVLARCVEHHPDRLYDLDDFGRVEDGYRPKDGQPNAAGDDPSGSGILQATDLEAAADTIPNPDLRWPIWNRIAMEFYAASGGSGAGLAAFDRWSAKASDWLYGGVEAKWEALEKNKPHSITAGSLVHRAQQAQPGFRLPSLGLDPKVDTGWQDADPHQGGRTRTKGNGAADGSDEIREAWRTGYDAGRSDALESEPPEQEPGKSEHERPPTTGPRSMAEFAGKPVPTLAYAAPLWVPLGKPVLFCGRGAAGKTTLACQLAAARAIGTPFLSMEIPKGRSLAVLCEEDESDVHRLLAQLVDNHFHRNFADFGDAYFWPRAGEDNALVWCDRRGQVQATPFYQLLAEQIGDTKPDLLVLDNARHVALINENDNAVVTAAWSLLHRLMVSTTTVASSTITTIGTTLLLGHTPKNGSAEFAGGASWENVARSRLYLGPLKADADEEPTENDPRRILRRGKANASGTASLEIVLDNGGFRLEHPDIATYGDRLARDMRRGQACQAFLDALATLTEQRRHTSHAPSAQNFAPKVMRAAGLGGDFTKAELETAMQTLFKDGRIKAGMELWRGPDRHPVVGIGRCG